MRPADDAARRKIFQFKCGSSREHAGGSRLLPINAEPPFGLIRFLSISNLYHIISFPKLFLGTVSKPTKFLRIIGIYFCVDGSAKRRSRRIFHHLNRAAWISIGHASECSPQFSCNLDGRTPTGIFIREIDSYGADFTALGRRHTHHGIEICNSRQSGPALPIDNFGNFGDFSRRIADSTIQRLHRGAHGQLNGDVESVFIVLGQESHLDAPCGRWAVQSAGNETLPERHDENCYTEKSSCTHKDNFSSGMTDQQACRYAVKLAETASGKRSAAGR